MLMYSADYVRRLRHAMAAESAQGKNRGIDRWPLLIFILFYFIFLTNLPVGFLQGPRRLANLAKVRFLFNLQFII